MSYAEPEPVKEQTSGKATAAVVCGVLSFCLSIFMALPAIILAILALLDISRSQGRLRGQGLAIAGLVLGSFGMLWSCILLALLLPAVQAAREAARRQQSMNNLKVICFAMHNYHDSYGTLPLAGSNDPQWGVQHSWRVRLLPFLDQSPMFERFNFDEPWDSPDNLQLVSQMPDVFKSPNLLGDDNKTVYLAIVGPPIDQPVEPVGGRFRGGRPVYDAGRPRGPRFRDFIDGTSNTILIVEADADQAVTWTKPDDLVWDPKDPRRGLGNLRPGGFLAVMVDGHVEFFPNTLHDDIIRALICRDDRMDVRRMMSADSLPR